jgi:hypothetical protein
MSTVKLQTLIQNVIRRFQRTQTIFNDDRFTNMKQKFFLPSLQNQSFPYLNVFFGQLASVGGREAGVLSI